MIRVVGNKPCTSFTPAFGAVRDLLGNRQDAAYLPEASSLADASDATLRKIVTRELAADLLLDDVNLDPARPALCPSLDIFHRFRLSTVSLHRRDSSVDGREDKPGQLHNGSSS